MSNIRDKNRVEYGRALFYTLGHENSAFITEAQLDELLFKSIRRCLGVSIYACMLLMAFGLSSGYEYNTLSLGERREKFLRESNWLQVNKRSKIKDFDSASKEEQEDALESLGKTERYWIDRVVDELIKNVQPKNSKGIEAYIKLLDGHLEKVRDASGRIIDYIPKATALLSPDDEEKSSPNADANVPKNPRGTSSQDTPDEELLPDELEPLVEEEQSTPDKSQQNKPSRSVKTEESKSTAEIPPVDEPEPAATDDEMYIDSPAETNNRDDLEEEPHFGDPEISAEIPPVDESETSHQSPPQQNLTYISGNSINNGKINNGTINHVNIVVKSEPHINLYWNRRTISLFIIMIAAVAGLVYFVFLRPLFVSVDKILVPDDPISLVPNEKYELEAAILPIEAVGAPLSYVSSDTSVVTVDHEGMLRARESHEVGGVQTADITIQAKSGATNVKTVTVNFSGDGYDAQDTVPTYQVEQRVRLAGTDEWKTNVENVKVGDLIEFRIKYTNTSDETQNSVVIKNILPNNLHYIPDSTVLTHAAYTLAIDQNTITTTGINIGHYEPGANAYVDFKAKVVDITLQNGSNTLVNWSQCGVGQVTLQDYATVQLYMEK